MLALGPSIQTVLGANIHRVRVESHSVGDAKDDGRYVFMLKDE